MISTVTRRSVWVIPYQCSSKIASRGDFLTSDPLHAVKHTEGDPLCGHAASLVRPRAPGGRGLGTRLAGSIYVSIVYRLLGSGKCHCALRQFSQVAKREQYSSPVHHSPDWPQATLSFSMLGTASLKNGHASGGGAGFRVLVYTIGAVFFCVGSL